MCVKDNLLVAGGFQGELVAKNLDRRGVSCCTKITYDENAMTNAIEMYDSPSGATQLITSNNDSVVRVFNMKTFSMLRHNCFPWAVNHTSISLDKTLVVVVGDHTDGLLVNRQIGEVVANLRGHLDYSFASACHPKGRYFATGNQDMTCRIWDVRNLSMSLTVLKGNIGVVRSLRFTSDGNLLAMVEPADFVHVFDVKHNYERCQEIDFFGEIPGISFSPDTESLFIGVVDQTYGSLLQIKCDPLLVWGYIEVHIEQGPVLEAHGVPLGVVTRIAGQTRLKVMVKGSQGHAGTIPMSMHRDPMPATTEGIMFLEKLHGIQKKT